MAGSRSTHAPAHAARCRPRATSRARGSGARALSTCASDSKLRLFDPLRKRPLPTSPGTIGVVTSLHGAAWHDIVNVVGRRYPLADLVLSPAQVQGAGAAESIVRALQDLLHEVSVDVVILARGGGASDDLSAFNDERVVRAVFASRVPVVTGVGHATDRTWSRMSPTSVHRRLRRPRSCACPQSRNSVSACDHSSLA